MRTPFPFALFALALTGCMPAATANLTPPPTQTQLFCEGQMTGLLNKTRVTLTLLLTPDGTASGRFDAQGDIFDAQGKAIVQNLGTTLTFNDLYLQLTPRTQGSMSPQLGFKKGTLSGVRDVGTILGGTADPLGNFKGAFSDAQGTHLTTLHCRPS